MEALTCKNCGAAIPLENIINDGRIAVCPYCDTVHYLEEETVPFPEKPKREEKQKRSIPDKFSLEQVPEGVELKYRWLGKQHFGLLFFAIFWNCFLLIFVPAILASGEAFPLLFMIPFVLVGVGMAYYVLTGFLNRTTIMINREGLDISYAPIPTIGTTNKTVDRRAIEQVYCTRRVAYESNNVPVYVFDVHYVEKGGGDETLVKGLDDLNKAVFIEQQIERIYKIEDMPVDTEYKGRYQ